jgi:hypothetical protein
MSGILQALMAAAGGTGPVGQVLYTGSGANPAATQYSFVVPANVTTISAVCIGAELSVGVAGGTLLLSSGASRAASIIGGEVGGGNGGAQGFNGVLAGNRAGGGGAGGYSGNGGAGTSFDSGTSTVTSGTPGAGAGGGGGGGASPGAGGGVGVLGQGSDGTAGGGSGSGGGYGGGSAGYASGVSPFQQVGQSAGSNLRWRNNIPVTPGQTLNVYMEPGDASAVRGPRACRILWGTARFFPSTNTGDM